MLTELEPKYPEVSVQLRGEDGKAFFIITRVQRALKNAGVSTDEIDQFVDEAMSGDYSNVLRTAMKWVDVA